MAFLLEKENRKLKEIVDQQKAVNKDLHKENERAVEVLATMEGAGKEKAVVQFDT